MATYGQSYDHLLKITAGDDPAHNLQLKAKIKDGESFNRGSAITLDTNGEWVAGDEADLTRVVCLAENGSADLDVNAGDDYNVANATYVGGFPCTGNFEFKTTEFVAGSIAPNDKLAPSSGTVGSLEKLATPTGATGWCGVVTKAPFTQKGYDIDVVQFLGVYFPGHAHA